MNIRYFDPEGESQTPEYLESRERGLQHAAVQVGVPRPELPKP